MKTDPKERLEEVKAMLAASVDMKGNPKPGFQARVVAIKEEIQRLEDRLNG